MALAAAVMLLASTTGACGGGSGETTVDLDAAPGPIVAAAALDGVHSGKVEASLLVDKLKTKEAISIRFNGSFKRLGEGDIPQLFLAATSQGQWRDRKIDFSSLLLVSGEEAEVSYGPAAQAQAYRVEPATLEGLRSKLDQGWEQGGKGNGAACLEAARGVDLAQLIRDPEIEGRRREADGTGVVSIVGDVEIARLQALFVELAEDPSCGAQMKALGLPSASALKGARVDFKKGFEPRLQVAVDRHGFIRSLSTRFECARLNGELFELQLDFSLQEPNRTIEVSGQVEGEPLDNLLRRFGTTQAAVLEADGSEALIAFLSGLGGAISGRGS